MGLKDTAAAKTHFLKLLELSPDDPVGHLTLAEIAFAEKNYALSVMHFKRTRDLYLQDPRDVVSFAQASFQSKKQPKGLQF